MNSGFINGFGINSAAYPQWVLRAAVVVSVAAASVAVAPTRITFATAYGDAAVTVTLTQTQTIAARATGYAGCNVAVAPTLIYSGASTAQATATGTGAVLRDVYATAGGDASCTGLALTAQALGDATVTCASTVVDARAHIVHPGRALQPCVANGEATGDVTRYPTVLAGWGEIAYTRGEASIKRSGNSYFEHDGYGAALASATGEVPQDKIKIIATLGSFDFANSDASSRAFIKYTARSLGTGVNTAQPVVATHIYRPKVTAQANASGAAVGTRVVNPNGSGTAQSASYGPKALIKHAASGEGTAQASVTAPGLRKAFGAVLATGSASNPLGVVTGTQHLGGALAAGAATGTSAAVQKFAGAASVLALASVADATAVKLETAYVYDAIATALVGRAYALANSEIRAPDDRSMEVAAEDRGMTVEFEDRTMVVTA